MKRKLIVFILFLAVLVFLNFAQLNFLKVEAKSNFPLTGPITQPVTYFIRGFVF